MAGEDDDRYATDLRESPPPPRNSRSSYQRSFEEDGRKGGFAADVRDKRENGDRFRQVPIVFLSRMHVLERIRILLLPLCHFLCLYCLHLRWTTASAPHQEGAKTFWILHISDLQ